MRRHQPTEEQEYNLINNPSGFKPDDSNDLLRNIDKNIQRLRSDYKNTSKHDLVKQRKTPKGELRGNYKHMMKVGVFGKKEHALLKSLSDLRPHTEKEITDLVKTKAFKMLKFRVCKRIASFNFVIRRQPPTEFHLPSMYLLDVLT